MVGVGHPGLLPRSVLWPTADCGRVAFPPQPSPSVNALHWSLHSYLPALSGPGSLPFTIWGPWGPGPTRPPKGVLLVRC